MIQTLDRFGGFDVLKLNANMPIVQARIAAFCKKLGIGKPEDHPAIQWFGFAKEQVVSLVIGVALRADGSIEVTNFFPSPTRMGVRAGYAGMALLKKLVDDGAVPYWIGPIATKNAFGVRHIEKFFGMKPVCRVYRYGGGE